MEKSIATGLRLLKAIANKDADIIICEFDMQSNRFITISESCEKIFGYTREEMEGQHYQDFTDNAFDALNIVEVESNIDKTKGSIFPNVYICKDQTKKIMLWATDEIIDHVALCYAVPISLDILRSLIIYKNYLDNES